MRMIVTGGAGFIGSAFCRRMLREHPGESVICLDALTYAASLEALSSLKKNPRFQFVEGDVRSRDTVYSLFEEVRPDAVVHFAAETHVDRSIGNPQVFLETNVLGAGVLLDACRDFGNVRFHQVSTDEVYGDLPLDRPDLLFTERSPLRPSSPYSASKAGADLLALSYFRTFGVPVTISRCSNNYGPCQHSEKLIPHMILRALEGNPLPVYGEGKNVRDWIHTEDHCAAVDLILRQGTPGEVYNVGASQERANLEIVRAILGLLGLEETRIEFVADRKGHDLRYAIDSSKLHQELGWTPQVDFQTGLQDTVQWYRERFSNGAFSKEEREGNL